MASIAIKTEPIDLGDTYRICRLCMSEESVDDVLRDDDLLNWILNYLSISISHDDRLSRAICSICRLRLTEFHQFRMRSQEVQGLLQSMMQPEQVDDAKIGQPGCDSETDSENMVPLKRIADEIRNIRQSIRDDGRFQCDICEKRFDNEKRFLKHKNFHGNRQYNCKHCQRSFVRWDSFLRHENYHEQFAITHKSMKQYDVGTEQHRDVNPAVLLENAEDTISQTDEKHDKSSSGLIGGPDEEGLLMEISVKQEPAGLNHNEPGQEGETNDMIDIGEIKIEPGVKVEKLKPFQCNICYKQCDDKPKLKRHKRVVHGPRIHTCTTCEFQTSLRRDLKKHLRTKVHFYKLHEKAGDNTCVDWIYDGKESDSEGPVHGNHDEKALSECLLDVKEEGRTSTIDDAAKSTAQNEGKNIGEQQFQCDICKKIFPPDKKQLLDHKWSAHGFCKHKCPICGRAYIYRFRMLQHMKIHETNTEHLRGKRKKRVKSLSCDLCPMKFTIQRSLEAHKKRKHGLSPHMCHLCTRTFAFPYELKIHLRNHVEGRLERGRRKKPKPDTVKPLRKRGRPKKVRINAETQKEHLQEMNPTMK